jgi:biopolymer transport protein TolR
MMTNSGGKKRLMSDINVTPFVDVMLVLLIIFMVTAPMMIQGEDVNLPKTESKPVKTPEDPLILTVNKKQEISIEKNKFELDELDERLKGIMKYRDNKDLLLRADEEISWGFVAKVIARIKGAGIEKLSLITEPEE